MDIGGEKENKTSTEEVNVNPNDKVDSAYSNPSYTADIPCYETCV